ncbi:unnamed protein product [Linum trigynum]|uniref:Reverse transcriptase domain-containing protein n=1 Tax=Linum trigynum TaxID=586398 RepID=A0AAV2EEN6_9ROSI
MEDVLAAVEPKVTPQMNQELLPPFTREEIWEALKLMVPTKAPGSDGMPALFFQKNWAVVGDTVCLELQRILITGQIPRSLNHTLLAMIPKTQKPSSPKDFRPIALCKVLYKILSKVLANRLKRILNEVITETQSAFVPGRNITDNIMVVFECFHAMKNRKQGRKGYVAAKLDIAKAYDRVE